MMKLLALLLGVHLAIVQSALLEVNETEWLAYKRQFNKIYENNEVESIRKIAFAHNKRRIDEFNVRNKTKFGFFLGLSHISDVSHTEFRQLYTNLEHNREMQNNPDGDKFLRDILNDNSMDVPDEVDWREVPNRVSPVKDQGPCSAGWAFSAVGALEGQEGSNQTSGLVELSVQNLLDCDTLNSGCYGGSAASAFSSISLEGGINDATSYPYEFKQSSCRFKRDKIAFTDKGFTRLPKYDEETMEKVVAKFGPVAVSIDASTRTFQLYKGGVYVDASCTNPVNHGVLIVGYGEDSILGKFWTVKNSWGSNWGEDGYIRIARNTTWNGQCGINLEPVIPLF